MLRSLEEVAFVCKVIEEQAYILHSNASKSSMIHKPDLKMLKPMCSRLPHR